MSYRRETSGEKISVVIPTFNRAKVLARVLPSYDDPRHVGEIIVVDDHSPLPIADDETIRALLLSVPLTILRSEKHVGTTGVKNIGLRHASHALTHFGEDDVQLCRDYYPNLLRDREALGVDFMGGEVMLMENPDETCESVRSRLEECTDDGLDERLGWLRFGVIRSKPMVARLVNALVVGPTDISRETAFDEKFLGPTYVWEEFDFQTRLRAKGYTLGITPHAMGLHLPREMTNYGGVRAYPAIHREVASVFVNTARFVLKNRQILRRDFCAHPILRYGILSNLRLCHSRFKRYIAYRYPKLFHFVAIRPARY